MDRHNLYGQEDSSARANRRCSFERARAPKFTSHTTYAQRACKETQKRYGCAADERRCLKIAQVPQTYSHRYSRKNSPLADRRNRAAGAQEKPQTTEGGNWRADDI